MMSISSQAGRRLAAERARLEQARRDQDSFKVRIHLRRFREAAEAVADELVAQGFHEMDGED